MTVARNQRNNGQVERVHGIIGDLLRIYPNLDWVEALPLIEFALNDSINTSTGYTPFYLAYGKEMKAIPTIGRRIGASSADLVAKMQETLEKVRKRLREVQEKMFTELNQKREGGEPLKVGQLVWLQREGIHLDGLKGMKEKLKPRWLGPYPVKEQVSDSHYEIELPPTLSRIHPRFHRERLKEYKDPKENFPSRTVAERPPANEETGEFEAEQIIDKRIRHKRVEYLVRWKGYQEQDNTWEPAEELGNCRRLIREYERVKESGGDVKKAKDSLTKTLNVDEKRKTLNVDEKRKTLNVDGKRKTLNVSEKENDNLEEKGKKGKKDDPRKKEGVEAGRYILRSRSK